MSCKAFNRNLGQFKIDLQLFVVLAYLADDNAFWHSTYKQRLYIAIYYIT